MNNRKLDNMIHQDAARVKEDVTKLVDDGAARFDRLEGDVNQATGKAREGVTTWVEDGAAQLSKGLEKLSGDAMETMAGTAKKVKQDVGYRLSQYNAKAQEAADNLSGDFGEKAAKYPWVSISIAVALGFLLGGLLLKPIRHTLQ